MVSNQLKEKGFCQEMTVKCLKNFQRTGNEMYRKHAREFYKLVIIWDRKLKNMPEIKGEIPVDNFC